jgi:glycosyltransferase involved in cell wall biosynthesis
MGLEFSTIEPVGNDCLQGESIESNGDAATDQFEVLRAVLVAQQRELDDLRAQLRAIHSSKAWGALRSLAEIRRTLAPHGSRRDRLAQAGLRRMILFKKWVKRIVDHAPGGARTDQKHELARLVSVRSMSSKYTVICLPIIEWSSRFQRPQQLMLQFAKKGHLVLFAGNRFHRRDGARVRSLGPHIFELLLPGDPTANIYRALPAKPDASAMAGAIAQLSTDAGISDAAVVAQHPYWTAVADGLRRSLGWPIVYDCMDDHAGFLHHGPEVLAAEDELVRQADLVVASSDVLLGKVGPRARASVLLRNACDYEHFARIDLPSRRKSTAPRIGFYGAIAHWFDGELVAGLAALRPDWSFELIGSTWTGNVRCLQELSNVRLLGERPYQELPKLIHSWDAFIIPFKRLPLTDATNPVKVYEMLATGKPVVAVGLPELVPIARAGLITLAQSSVEFAREIERALRDDSPQLAERRKAFARCNTWQARQSTLAEAIEGVRRRIARD